MTNLLYLEINGFAMIVIALLLFNQKKAATMILDDRLFRYILLSVFTILALDTVGWLINGATFANAGKLLMLVNTLYYFMSGVIEFLWLLYADYRLFGDMERLRRRLPFYFIPFALLTLGAFSNPFTGWIFYIDSANYYARGSLAVVNMFISWLMLFYSAVLSYARAKQYSTKSKRTECWLLSSFTFLPLSGGILQGYFYGLPLLWICVTVSLLIVFINIQNRQISLDALTGLNNRRAFNRYLEAKANTIHNGDSLYLILLDVDFFKSINDTYGHTAGDAALILISDMLKRVCGRSNDFLARYGGDEFAIIRVCAEEQSVVDVIKAVNDEAEIINQSNDVPYRLSLSSGYAFMKDKSSLGIDALISEADTQMYLNKKRRNSQL